MNGSANDGLASNGGGAGDVEAPEASVEEQARAAALRRAGQAHFDAVLARAGNGDPFQPQAPRPRAGAAGAPPPGSDEAPALPADAAAFGAFLERHRHLVLATGCVVAQGSSWVLMKGALISMKTPAVLTFLHLVAAALVQLALVSYGALDQPRISSAAARGALVQATLTSAELLLSMAVLEVGSVYMLLAWTTVAPLALGSSRAADVGSKALLAPPQQLRVPLAVGCLGLALETAADRNRGVLPLVLLLLWCCVAALQLLWRQVKQDATLGHRVMDPSFLFNARQLSDLEDSLSPSSLAFLSSCLPAVPVLVLGLVGLEGKDLVDHEPSVPTLSVLLLSCAAFAGAANLRTLLASSAAAAPELQGLLTAAAAAVAVLLDFLERAHALGVVCLLGVCMAVSGSLAAHWARWQQLATRKSARHST